MNNRILDFAEAPARLSAREGRLHIESADRPPINIPFDHLAAIVCSHGQVTFTQAVLSELAAANAILISCDTKHLPVAMMLPLVAHHRQTTSFQRQATAPLPLRKRLWRDIVAAKIRAQAQALLSAQDSDAGLGAIARRVNVTNASTMEALAGRHYWAVLFGEQRLRRSDEEDARNALLDYGYAVVRAIAARALCAAGLHPGLALHHHNQDDPYPLANDLMEPFRPLADLWAVGWCASRPSHWALDRPAKQSLLSWLTGRFTDGAESRSLFDWAGRSADQLARCLEAKRSSLDFPELRCVPPQEMARPKKDPQRVPRDVALRDVRSAG
ncbi:MAG: type II CRISPR-associated endonuclease Cas1 [Bryobacteraceae bacterium]|nr:type II CRISPR-associated endonuclease Cas1 [Bryobacteraceae bacterium]